MNMARMLISDFPINAANLLSSPGTFLKKTESCVSFLIPSFCPYTEDGDYKKGLDRNSPEINIYHEEQCQWHKENPLPVELIHHCSGDYMMFFLAVRSSFFEANRGYPVSFDPKNLTVTDEEVHALIIFCKTYRIKDHEQPKWWLSSMWF